VILRSLPSVDRLLATPALNQLTTQLSHDTLVELARFALQEARQQVNEGASAPSIEALSSRLYELAKSLTAPAMREVINATGVVLHTNLGRAPLSKAAQAAAQAASQGYLDLEFDLESGERGSRLGRVESLITRLTGAEAAFAVNNNAAAVLLGLTSVAAGREVIVSRGQAVEIGGGFRIPDVLAQSGARLVEVGTTNRTYLRDYEAAITPETAALLRVHPSNFQVVGFTTSVSLPDLVGVARERDVLVLDDLGSGCLLDTTRFGLPAEPMVQASVGAGADLVFFSGDKLLGGPQAGLIGGRRELVEKLRRHPLARAMRLDKATIASLAATLLHYLRDEALNEIPVWRMLSTPLIELERRASAWEHALGEGASTVRSDSAIGGGSLPGATLPTWCLALGSSSQTGAQAMALAAALRQATPPVVARIEADIVLLDPRTVLPHQNQALLAACRQAMLSTLFS